MELKVLSQEEVNRLLMAPDHRTVTGRRDRAFLAVMVLGGLRLEEACKLRVDEVFHEGKTTRLTFTGKGRKMRTVTLTARAAHLLAAAMADLPPGQTHIFHSIFGKPLSTRGGRDILYRHRDAAGLPSWLHPHSLRHTYATMLMRASGNIFLVQRVLGHSSPSTTAKHYLSWNHRDSDQAAELLNAAYRAFKATSA